MNLWELIVMAVENIRGNKLRSFLTTLGIVIGIAAVISVVAIGQGGRTMLMQEMENIGVNIFAIYVDYREGESQGPNDLTLMDVSVIKQAVPEVKYLAPLSYNQMKLRGTKGQKSVQIIGTTADYNEIRNFKNRWGRFISEDDNQALRRVIVLEEDTAKILFGSANPVGKQVMIDNNSAMVAGVLKKETSQLGFNSGQTAYIPISVFSSMTGWSYINDLEGSAVSKEQVEPAMEKSKQILARRHNAGSNHYVSYSMEQEMQSANKITGIVGLIISCIAGISLLVGGIGVMNIMLVSVTERTREIGIRMALGAERKDILVQFLIESIVLCLLGGLIGVTIGYGGAWIVAKIAKWPSLVSWSTILLAFGFSAGVGLFFGIYPANQASKLNPIDALRRE